MALGAAVLWGLGTVFGRFLSRRLAFEHVLTVRFAFGFVASAIALPIVGAAAYAGLHDSIWIAYLALVTGAAALTLYYYGLRRTPATLASVGELAYPVTAGIVGYVAFGATAGLVAVARRRDHRGRGRPAPAPAARDRQGPAARRAPRSRPSSA